MSDSKGAAIEKLLEKLTVKTGEEYHRLHSGKLSFEIADSRMRYYEKEAAEAILAILAQEVKPDKVDRFEVIDETGRAYVKGSIYGSPVSVELSYQDDGRTLKVFVKSAPPKVSNVGDK